MPSSSFSFSGLAIGTSFFLLLLFLPHFFLSSYVLLPFSYTFLFILIFILFYWYCSLPSTPPTPCSLTLSSSSSFSPLPLGTSLFLLLLLLFILLHPCSSPNTCFSLHPPHTLALFRLLLLVIWVSKLCHEWLLSFTSLSHVKASC